MGRPGPAVWPRAAGIRGNYFLLCALRALCGESLAVPRRAAKKPTRDFSQCRLCGYVGLFWAPKTTRETEKPLDQRLAICLDRSGRPDEYDVRASDGYFDAKGWRAEGRRTQAEPTEDGLIFRAAPIHQCDPAAVERWQGRATPALPAMGGQDRAAGETG